MTKEDKLRDIIKELAKLAYKEHYYCEDSYYSCPLSCEGCSNDSYPEGTCNCGADEHNAKILELLGKCP